MTVSPPNSLNNKTSKSAVDKKRLLELMLKKKGIKSKGVKKSINDKNHIAARENNDLLTLSSAQQRLWFLEEFTAGTAAYVFCNKVDLKGCLNIEALKKSYQTIVDRHEIFRTCYQQENGVPHQIISDDVKIDIRFIDLSNLENNIKQKKYLNIAHTESTQPFSLNTVPLMRMCIVKLKDNHHVVLQTIHHIVYDGWSLAVMYNELKTLYEAYNNNKENPLPSLEIQYADFSRWQKQNLESAEMQKQLDFWKDYLAGSLPVLELPVDNPRSANQSYNGALHKIKLSASLSESLRVFALKNECTLSMVMLTAFKILLHRYTNETDILVGMPIANRNHHQIENLIGFFVNSLVLRTSLDFDPSVEELLSRVRLSSSKAYSNQDLPFDRIVDEIQPERDLSHNPIFQVMFAFQNTPDLPESLGDMQMDLEVLDNDTSVFDLTLNLHDETSGIHGYFEYCNELFEAQTIERMQGHYLTILEALIANPKSKISQIQILTKSESQQLLTEWNATETEINNSRTIHQLIEEQVIKNPDATAICHTGNQLSYSQLNKKANQLARQLQVMGVKPDTIVAICIERCSDMFVSILAILKAGGAYLPLDPAYPSDRLSFMLEDSGADILLSHADLINTMPEHKLNLFCVDRDWYQLEEFAENDVASDVNPDHLAYIIYTSGSTGKPKGVMVSHRNLVHSTCARIEYYPNTIEKFLLLSSFAFDSSVAGIFWTLCQGGELHLPKQGDEKDIQQVALLLKTIQATHMLSLPSIYNLLLSVSEDNQLDSLNTIIVAGESCPPELLAQHESKLPKASLYNEYGPTEGTVWSTVYKLTKQDSKLVIPIGKPIVNVQTYILDKNKNPVPIGVIGEIYIGGQGITRGYLNREEMTAQRYVFNPFSADNGKLYRTGDLAKYNIDGNIIFCGRTDHQVKIRGYRIELGEIESALLNHSDVEDVVVIAKEKSNTTNGPKTQQLVAYVVGGSKTPEVETLKLQLKESLPEYMVPQFYIFMDKLPLSPNGKIDIKALPEIDKDNIHSKVEYAAASNYIEEVLVKIWSDILGIKRVGVYDNFFEIGGDSILSIQIISRAKTENIHLSPKQIFQYVTIAELAKVAKTEQLTKAEQGLITGEVPLIPIQHWLLSRALPNPDYWNQAEMFEVPKDISLELLEKAMDQLLLHHDMLRTCFINKNNQWTQEIQSTVESIKILRFDLSETEISNCNEIIKEKSNQLQSSLSLQQAQLFAVAHFKMPESDSYDRLFIVIHHLVVDTVSWSIIIEDLKTLYQQLFVGDGIKLPEKTSSYKDWSLALQEYVISSDIEKEISYWNSLPDNSVFVIPQDKLAGNNTEESERRLEVSLTEEETRQLLQDVPAVYNTKIDDILLTALAQVITCWAGLSVLSIEMEGHGREQINENIDLSRSVGWFTTSYPVSLKYENSYDADKVIIDNSALGQDIISIKEQLRAIPNKGLGYGVLRYLSNDLVLTKKLSTVNRASILYNYLGQFKSDKNRSSLLNPGQDFSRHHDLSGPRSHLLEIDAMIVEGCLKLDWVYSKNLHDIKTIEELANKYISALRQLIKHCQSPESGGVSASDFPDADLDQDELGDLLDMLED